MTEAEVSELFWRFLDRVLAQAAPEGEPSDADLLLGAVVDVVTRHVVGRRREEVLRRLVEVKRN